VIAFRIPKLFHFIQGDPHRIHFPIKFHIFVFLALGRADKNVKAEVSRAELRSQDFLLNGEFLIPSKLATLGNLKGDPISSLCPDDGPRFIRRGDFKADFPDQPGSLLHHGENPIIHRSHIKGGRLGFQFFDGSNPFFFSLQITSPAGNADDHITPAFYVPDGFAEKLQTGGGGPGFRIPDTNVPGGGSCRLRPHGFIRNLLWGNG
jgi:hypothetical protein